MEETPIHMAVCRGHTEIFKILAPLTDNPNAPDKYGQTPSYWASRYGHKEIVKFLNLKSGKNSGKRTKISGQHLTKPTKRSRNQFNKYQPWNETEIKNCNDVINV